MDISFHLALFIKAKEHGVYKLVMGQKVFDISWKENNVSVIYCISFKGAYMEDKLLGFSLPPSS